MMMRGVFVALLVSTPMSAFAAMPLGGSVNDDSISLIYDPSDGNISLDAAGSLVSTLEVVSIVGVFTGPDHARCFQPSHPFCLPTPSKFFVLNVDGMGDTDFGNRIAVGLTGQFLSQDLTVNGSVLPSGWIGTVDLIVVPEPSGVAWWFVGLLGGLSRHRRVA